MNAGASAELDAGAMDQQSNSGIVELGRLRSRRGEADATDVPGDGAPPVSRQATFGRTKRVTRLLMQAVLPVLVIAGGVLGYRYLKATKPEPPRQQVSEQVFPVVAAPVAFANASPVLSLYGTTVAGRQVEIRALVAGRVEMTGPGLRSGAEVTKGEQLLTIDRFDYESALRETEAQLAEARARLAEQEAQLKVDAANLKFLREQLTFAETDLGRAEPLGRQGTVTQRTVDDRRMVVSQRRQAATQLENNVALVNARMAQQRAVIERLATSLDRARQRLIETRLEAPFNAYVTDVGAQVGRMMSVNDRVATLIDRDWIEVRFTLTDRQFGRLAAASGRLEGSKITVRWDVAADAPTYAATIERFGARVTADSGGIEVFARIDDPLRPVPLRPGAFVEVIVPDVAVDAVVRIASSAVYDRRTVYVIVDGRMQPRAVEIVGSDGEAVLVRGKLAAGERVIITRLSTPGAGVRVEER